MEDLSKKVNPGRRVSVQTGLGRRWLLPLWFFVFLIGFSSQLKAASDFATTEYNKIIHKPSVAEPYFVVRVLFYDADGKDSFFTHYKADGKNPGPAVYVDGNYVCSPDWELAWPNGSGDDGGDGSDGAVKDECRNNDGWWGSAYTKKGPNGETYTIKFWNPVCNSDDKRYVDMYIFIDKFLNSASHTVKIKGRWRTNNANPVAVNKEKVYEFSGFTMGVGGSTTEMTGIGKMKVSGNLKTNAFGTFTIGTIADYTTSSMIDNLTSKKELTRGAGSFQDVQLNCYNRTDYYSTFSANHIEYIISGNVTVNNYTTGVKIYQWYRYECPGYMRPKDLKISTYNMWEKKIKLTWSSEGSSEESNQGGKWSVYRYPKGNPSARERVASNLSFSTGSATITAPEWDTEYTYEVALIPSDDNQRNELTVSANFNVARNWGFHDVKADVDAKDESKIKLTWNHSSIADASGSNNYTLTVQRSDDYNVNNPDEATWDNLTTQQISSSETSSGYYSDGASLVSKKTYYYRLKVNVMNKDMYSDIVPGRLGGSKLVSFAASRGTYTNMVKLQWRVKQVGTDLTNFSLQRRPLGSTDDKLWNEIYSTSGTAESYSYDDQTAQAGSFSQYRIVIWSMEGDTLKYDDTRMIDGFSMSSGIVSGNIAYGTGTAVPGVKVTLKQQSVDGNSTGGLHSLLFNGESMGLVYESNKDDLAKLMGEDFSVQMWIYPQKTAMGENNTYYHLFNVNGVFTLRLHSNGSDNYALVANSTSGRSVSEYEIPGDQWSHLTVTYKKVTNELNFYLIKGENLLVRNNGDHAPDVASASTYKVGVMTDALRGDSNNGLSFQGYMDEFRFWSKALTEDEVKHNYNHPMSGNEAGLAIYYPLDEGIPSQTLAYDFSKTDGAPNGRHALTTKAASSSTELPSESQFSLMSYTDSLGYYEVRGVPFMGEGTSYSIVPTMGIHEFSPARQSRFVSQSSLIHNGIDFDDVSSFPVSGKVLYCGTTYPVDGANLYVDGAICSKNGELIETNENGEFTISVPIGKHFIQVKKNGHEFVNEGRYPADPAHTGNEYHVFDSKVTGLEFRDTTLVNFTGRVVGGDIENDNPVGFRLSSNNVGIARLVLTPVNVTPIINAVKHKISETSFEYRPNTEIAPVASATDKIHSNSWRGENSSYCRMIFIETDSVTGEFSAMVPPLEYTIGDIVIKSTGNIVGGNVNIDLTNPTHDVSDTLKYDDGTFELYSYLEKYALAFHSEPHFVVTQDGREDGSFGMDSYVYSDALRKDTISDIFSVSNGKVTYNYGETGHKSPLFVQGNSYTFLIEGFEQYENYDSNPAHPVVTKVPLKDVVVTIDNALSSDQSIWLVDGDISLNGENKQAAAGGVVDLKSNQLALNDEGLAKYKWMAGLPNVASPYTRTIAMSYDINGRTYQWDGSGMEGIIIGDLPTGNNFVTSGPDKLLMILRDPPGTGSSAEWSEGTVHGVSKTKNDVWSDDASVGCTFKFGLETTFISGYAAGAIAATSAKIESKDDLTTTAVMENEGEKGRTIETSTSINRSVSTSGEPDFVGADGDVFIGQATNLIFGNARHVGFERTQNGFGLGLRNVISTGVDFKTTFSYTQSYIENTLIPNYKMIRSSVLTYATPAEIAAYNPEGGVGMHEDGVKKGNYYLTSLSPDDEHYGEEGTYTVIIPKPTKDIPKSVNTRVDLFQWCIKEGFAKSDTIAWINNQIENWESYLAFNEKEKVKAFENRKNEYSTNYSFDGGTSVSYSIESDSVHTSSWDWVVKAGLVVGNHTGFDVTGFGMDFDVEVSAMGGRHEAKDEYDEYTSSFSYTLADEGIDAISVDVYSYGAFGPIFRTRGGQTSNPYEGKVVTKYYKPGTTIMEATMQIEVPQIDATNKEVVDIPSGSVANYELQLSNISEIGEDVTYKLFVLDESNPDGAQLSIDGKVLTDGRLIKVPGNQTLTKSLQLRQTNLGILEYDSIAIVFASESQPEEIADTIYIRAKFVPSASPVSLAIANKTMNNVTGSNLVLTLKNFDKNYNNQKYFRLEYQIPGATNWIRLKEYAVDNAYVNENNEKLPEGGTVNFVKDFESFSDGNYKFRAVSVATYGNDEVYQYSDEIDLIKDVMSPRPLGTPEPSDGVLDIGDDISLSFNETILKGVLSTDNNFTITGVLNGTPVAHETALSMKGSGTIAQTDAGILLAGKDFSIDMWVNLGGSGTILSHGSGTSRMALGVDADNKLNVTIGKETYVSRNSVPAGEWVFLSMSYKTTKNGGLLNATVASDAKETKLFVDSAVVSYNGNGVLAVGNVPGSAIHELLLWDEAHSMSEALLNRNLTKSPSTRHLIGYWKMNEGEGTEIRDYSRNRHMTMSAETWYLNNENKAVSLDGASYISMSASGLPIYADDDYAVEFWMRGGVQTGEAQLIQMGDIALWLDANGQLQFTGKGAYHDAVAESYVTSAVGLNDNKWHHIALNVLRQGAAAVYVDGKRCLTANSSSVGSIVTNNLIVGARRITEGAGMYSYTRPFKGQIDEIRVWGATMNADLLIKNRKVRYTGSENGLAAYYAFEKKGLDAYNQIVTMGDPADLTGSGVSAERYVIASDQQSSLIYVDDAPAMRVKPVETNVSFTFTASDDKIYIQITEDPATIEGCTLNFSVRDIGDLNGNYLEAANWSAFVNRKELVWDDDELSLEQQVKDESSITATIVNKGGQQQMWTLSGMPSWLEASADYGVTNPRSESVVTFRVSPATPIGKYEQVIYLTDNDGINVPLTLNVKVTGNEPDWSVNAKKFENSMSIIGSLDFLGVMSDDEDDIVAAFIGEECRGLAHPVYKERYDGYYVTMDIYGNSDDNAPLTFRAYDASTGTLYPEVNASPATAFKELDLKGTYADPILLTAVDKIEQTIQLKEGWNWISLYVNSDVMSVASLLAKIADDVVTIKSQNAYLSFENGSWGGSLTGSLTNDQMYAVKMKADRTLRLVGARVEPSANPVTIYNGWNWIGYYGRQVSTVTDALADLSPVDGNIIKGQSGVAYYDTYEWAGSLSILEPGNGYKLNVALGKDESKRFGYPSSVVNLAPVRSSVMPAPANGISGTFHPVDFRNYSGNAIMAVKVLKDNAPLANAEVGVFADGECRAAAVTDNAGIAYLTIPGDDAVELTFKVAYDAEVTDISDVISYETDGIYGSPQNPIVFGIGDPTGIGRIEISAESDSEYDLMGRKTTDSQKGIRIREGKKIFRK